MKRPGKATGERPGPARPVRAKAPGAETPDRLDPRFAAIVEAFGADRRVARKRIFSSDAVLTVDGKIFAMFVRDRLVVKLPRPRVDALVAAGKAERFDPGHGRLMKEWAACTTKRGWLALSREAYAFVGATGTVALAPKRRRGR